MSNKRYTLSDVREVMVVMEDGMTVLMANPRASVVEINLDITTLEHFSPREGLAVRDMEAITQVEKNAIIRMDDFETLSISKNGDTPSVTTEEIEQKCKEATVDRLIWWTQQNV